MKNKVIIIDSGVDITHPNFRALNIESGLNFCNGSEREIIDDILGHGTAITSIIHSINREADLHILKIFDYELVAYEGVLLEALRYILNKDYKDSIIHMSLGVSYLNEELFDICYKLHQKGNLIISAFDNSGGISYPAAFDFVIGVEAAQYCVRASDFFLPEDEVVDVYSKGGVHRVAWIDNKSSIRQGNSISAAYVTGYLSLCLREHSEISKSKALTYLQQETTLTSFEGYDEEPQPQSRVIESNEYQTIKKAAVFPYNKEISNLIHFSDLLPFRIEQVCSSKYIGNLGKEIKSFDGDYKYIIENIDNICFENIDTLIIGHLTELENISGKKIKEKLLNDCLLHRVNVFSLDSMGLNNFYENFEREGISLVTPTTVMSMKNKIILKKKHGKLHKINAPVIGVFGTSSKQGKFTLQLFLRSLFLKNGYKVSQLSTEPTGILYGMNETIPFGFNSDNQLNQYEFINLVNESLSKMDQKNPDLIIAGSQSATVAQSFNHLGNLAVKQLDFLMGLLPDGVILCINPNDELDYIKRTIQTIENVVPTKVICIVVYPFYYKNGWNHFKGTPNELELEDLLKVKKYYCENLEIPVFSSKEINEVTSIYELIIDYFS
ncbi:DUF1611 domain-containing protein [Paenibacillus sp. FSL H7-0737]|uniref:DUF1611 domain-containing protein n=1 Tax=Paenibacillus sp. FSL H7-0737 TaxID=1536775 RepID=UPI0004F7732C|nr:DUF1611 domain-containing protein [Paenibacillus sp. FSL H7-0737]AIQ22953.1 hypothetical protein H70737_08860 [Paenibacillus sp. FSL H7-0737]